MTTNKVKPFYIDCEDLAQEEIVEIIEKSVQAGAGVYDCVEECASYITDAGNIHDMKYKYWGVDGDGDTYCYDNNSCFGDSAIEITFDRLDEHLRLTNPSEVTDFRGTKIDLRKEDGTQDVELKEAVLEVLFDQGFSMVGYDWSDNTNYEFIYINNKYIIAYVKVDSRGEDFFNTHEHKQIHFTYERKLEWKVTLVEPEPLREIITLSNGDKYYADDVEKVLKVNGCIKITESLED